MLRLFLLVLFSIMLSCGGAIAAGSTSEPKIKKLIVNIPADIEKQPKTREALIGQLISMGDQPFVYLDLSVKSIAGQPRPYSWTVHGKPGKFTSDSGIGPLAMGAGIDYSLGPIAGYNHLLLSIYTGDRSLFPYLDVSLEYSAMGEGGTVFHVRGFFHIVENAIPTARSFQLRPFNPPFEIAAKILDR